LIRDAQVHPKCPRCGNVGAGAELPALAYAGFLARLDNTAVADEEERWGAKDNVQVHPSWDAERVAGRWRLSDGFSLEWRRRELLYWLNEGPESQDGKTRYRLCPHCGKLLTPPANPEPAKKKAMKVPARAGDGPDLFGHGANCPRKGQDVPPIARTRPANHVGGERSAKGISPLRDLPQQAGEAELSCVCSRTRGPTWGWRADAGAAPGR
jgi:hypothetical protein